jgi:hypothetical protein
MAPPAPRPPPPAPRPPPPAPRPPAPLPERTKESGTISPESMSRLDSGKASCGAAPAGGRRESEGAARGGRERGGAPPKRADVGL